MMAEHSTELPDSWRSTELSEIAVINPTIDKASIPNTLEVSFVPMPAVEAGTGVINVSQTRLFGEVKKGYTPFQEGDVLFAKITPCMENGKMAVVPQLKGGVGFGSTEFHVLRPHPGISKNYLYYYVSSESFRREAEHNMSGAVGQRRVTTPYLTTRKLPLPPEQEQKRIVAKIEELFFELDRGIESLKTAQAQLKVYRQVLLKHAFEGKLTAQWRVDNADKLETADDLLKRIKQERTQRYQQQLAEWENGGAQGSKPKAPKDLSAIAADELTELPKIPTGWKWIRPEEICAQEPYAIGIGPFGSNLKVSDYRESGVPLIFVKNITRSDFASDLKFIDDSKYAELTPHSVKALDLLITKMGDPPGDCEIYPEGSPNAVLTADCLKFRLWNEFANRKLYKFCINSNLIKRQLGLITKGVAQKKISVERFKTICLPFFCVEEQNVLLQELEAKLSECDQLEQALTSTLQQAAALRQSILKKAFAGQLVPQDPNDEPASALLARIKAEYSA
ncbi:restriction endonuclease subunit S [Cupriavidus neocaledonicus]|uniref:Restriction modification system DNA specificity domain-containing protein n=1 Tax=Cupriavidus neocaledonicus TaxID=1040979 RepID=A0ABY1UVC2_9BURK|nr:restriction endonuclease subunit S [Cupriavidus neocaledonicus]SOZ34141.1 Restriction modification system DNA specificity domain-containing protein [Cupriavidus neocaledonicus]